MDFSLTETERDLVGLCRDFARKEIAPRAPEAWEAARCPTDLLREMGELGLLGMLVPEEWGAFGLSEPDAGSDARGIRTRAERRDGGWLINGRKAFISNAGTDMSFGVTLLARTEADDGQGQTFASFVVEKDTPGF